MPILSRQCFDPRLLGSLLEQLADQSPMDLKEEVPKFGRKAEIGRTVRMARISMPLWRCLAAMLARLSNPVVSRQELACFDFQAQDGQVDPATLEDFIESLRLELGIFSWR